ncbi:MAG: histidine kinase [Saprospiraceae bacterium]|nr:MAG: histidine kinase [Saprospiraceae bacterium]
MKAIAGHLLFWLIITLTYAASEWGYRDNFAQAILFEVIFLPSRLIAVYVNWFILIPRLLYQNKVFSYLCILTILLFLLATLQRYYTLYWAYPVFFPSWMTQPPQPLVFFRIVQNLVIITSPVAFSTGIKLFFDWYDQKNKTRKLEKEKAEAELKYLRSQINPHFLFNTLNSLYGLSLEKSDKVPKLLLKLSDLLSYSLYESAVKRIHLKKELQLIKDFIALEKERYEDRVNITWKIKEADFTDLQLAPLLLMPLVENAFKHGVKEESNQAHLSISLFRQPNGIVFEVINTIPAFSSPEDQPEGIGLANLGRRLEILYPGQYELITRKANNHFVATLKLNVHA